MQDYTKLTEDELLKKIEKIKWANGFECRKCKCPRFSVRIIKNKKYRQCSRSDCKTLHSIIANTAFEGNKLPVNVTMKILLAMQVDINDFYAVAKDYGIPDEKTLIEKMLDYTKPYENDNYSEDEELEDGEDANERDFKKMVEYYASQPSFINDIGLGSFLPKPPNNLLTSQLNDKYKFQPPLAESTVHDNVLKIGKLLNTYPLRTYASLASMYFSFNRKGKTGKIWCQIVALLYTYFGEIRTHDEVLQILVHKTSEIFPVPPVRSPEYQFPKFSGLSEEEMAAITKQ